MENGLTELLAGEASSAKRSEGSKRDSLQSGISEFSFEHHDEVVNTKSTDRLTSPVKASSKIEQIVKTNSDLMKRSAEQSTLISALRSHIAILENTLRDHNITVPEFSEPAMLKESVIRSLNIEPPSNKPVEKLQLPPRSADRLRTSPLRSPVTQRSARSQDALAQLNGESDAEIGTSSSTLPDTYATQPASTSNIDLEDEDLTETPQDEDFEEGDTVPMSPKSEILKLDMGDIQAEDEDALVSPSPMNASVDWGAAIEALKTSADEPVSAQQEKQLPETKAQKTTYTGRIASPSPYKPSQNPTSPLSSHISNTVRTPQIHGNSLNGTSPENYKRKAPISPTRVNQQESRSGNGLAMSVPVTPAVSARSPMGTEMPLSKGNMYDPFHADFHQQAYKDYTNLATPQLSEPPLSPVTQMSSSSQLQPSYPSDVPLFVDPAYLSTVKPEIISTIHGNPTKKSDDPFVSIAVLDRQTNKEMWRFRKSLSQIIKLDTEIRPIINTFSLPPVPEKSIFLTNLPVKVDSRRVRIKDYFSTLFVIPNIPLDAAYKIARFMSLDVINLLDESNMDVMKEGWLLRRTKGLGNNWKARYCQIDGPFINVYEAPEGAVVEIIKLTGSQIGRQPDDSSDDKSAFRHAFAIMEAKKGLKSNSFTKHIFCAETDIERDLWVNVLVQLLDDGGTPSIYSADSTLASSSVATPQKDVGTGFSPDSASVITSMSPSKPSFNYAGSVDNEESTKESKRQKKRSFFPFSKAKLNEEIETYKQHHDAASAVMESNIEKSLQGMDLNQGVMDASTVFQNELSAVLKLSSHEMYGVSVPSIMYRCITYLLVRSAVYEEGIFRLSGSSALIKQLRATFDKAHDVDFLQLETRPDINTIAGLLKLWLRELPSNILTKQLYPRFKDASDGIRDPAQLSMEYARLAQSLPRANYTVLYVLFKFLNDVIQNKDANKMNLRNLCIVFSPTLNIASDVIVPFLVDFKCIFEDGAPIGMEEREVMDLNIPTF